VPSPDGTEAARPDLPEGLPDPARLERLLGWRPAKAAAIGGGRNSRVFRLEAGDGPRAALKRYFRHPGDPRDRLATEFGALAFCHRHGLPVPRPLAKDPGMDVALYEWVDGAPVETPDRADADAAVAFLLRLRGLAGEAGTAAMPAASEACFSFRALEANLQARLGPLHQAAADFPELRAFLREDLVPAWEALLAGCREGCRRAGMTFDQELPSRDCTLSPSDFGFHNALRREGSLVFLDFEYFGWDDPAKTLCDLLLHPGMTLSAELRARLAQGLLAGMADLPDLAVRTRLAFPLYGIKWCLILLNEFLRGPLERRAFARPGEAPETLQARQLHKAQGKLRQLLDDHGHFPYFPA